MLDETQIITDETLTQWRITPIDLDDMGVWLVARLQEKHPEATGQQILSWLRGCQTLNSMFFVRTRHAAALAEITRIPLEPQPVTTVHFVMVQNEDFSEEAAMMFPAIASWAANQNASRVIWFDTDSDVTRGVIKGRVGGFNTRSQAFLRLGRLD